MSRGRFVVLEGGEGAGKSTNARYIESWLRGRGRRTLMTREPGGTPLAEAIRELVLGHGSIMPARTELLLMFAARAAHVEQAIRPALLSGVDVICDRFVDSSYAYQGAGRGIAAADVEALERMTIGDCQPDLVIVFDLDPETGLERAQRRGDQNRFEAEQLAFRRRVREAFLQRARQSADRYAIINADQTLEAVQSDLKQELERRL